MNKILPHSFNYQLFDVYLDYLKTIFGLFIGLGGLIYGLDNTFSRVVFGAILIIFLVFGFHSIRRHRTSVHVDEKSIEISSFSTQKITWNDIENIELKYFGKPVKDKDVEQKPKGVLHLNLRDSSSKLTVDSNLHGFKYLVWCATQFTKECKAPLDPSTIGNMLDIGLDPEGKSEMPDPKMSGF